MKLIATTIAMLAFAATASATCYKPNGTVIKDPQILLDEKHNVSDSDYWCMRANGVYGSESEASFSVKQAFEKYKTDKLPKKIKELHDIMGTTSVKFEVLWDTFAFRYSANEEYDKNVEEWFEFNFFLPMRTYFKEMASTKSGKDAIAKKLKRVVLEASYQFNGRGNAFEDGTLILSEGHMNVTDVGDPAKERVTNLRAIIDKNF